MYITGPLKRCKVWNRFISTFFVVSGTKRSALSNHNLESLGDILQGLLVVRNLPNYLGTSPLDTQTDEPEGNGPFWKTKCFLREEPSLWMSLLMRDHHLDTGVCEASAYTLSTAAGKHSIKSLWSCLVSELSLTRQSSGKGQKAMYPITWMAWLLTINLVNLFCSFVSLSDTYMNSSHDTLTVKDSSWARNELQCTIRNLAG